MGQRARTAHALARPAQMPESRRCRPMRMPPVHRRLAGTSLPACRQCLRQRRGIRLLCEQRGYAHLLRSHFTRSSARTLGRSRKWLPLQTRCQHGRRRLWHLQTQPSPYYGLPTQSHTRTLRAAKRHEQRQRALMAAQDDALQSHRLAFLEKIIPTENEPTLNPTHNHIRTRALDCSGSGKADSPPAPVHLKNTGAPRTNRAPEN